MYAVVVTLLLPLAGLAVLLRFCIAYYKGLV